MGKRMAWCLAGILAAFTAGAEPPARFGIGIKCGEAAGGFGSQFSYNFDRHWQADLGAGGTSPFSWSTSSINLRTDSYFALGRYYFDHLYLSTGYSLKVTRAEMIRAGAAHVSTHAVSGIPIHVGYEFGDRRGFFFAASAGALWVPAGGGKTVSVTVNGDSASETSAASGPSVGLSLGYYLW